jgi:peptide/nickel transport system ATP-binding protein
LRPYTRGLLACRPPLDYRPEKLPTVDTFLKCEKIDKTNRISKQDRLTDHLKIYNRKPVLEIQTIGKKFSSRNGLLNKKKTNIALEGVSFFVYPGETLGIVGESGSGKTTMARVILALIPPTTGKIFFQGNDITNLSSGKLKKFRKSIQIIFQDPYSSLNPRISVGETILEPMKIHGLITNNKSGKERVVSLLEQVGMNKDHYERYPHELSGGQRQRICIARALAIEPALIICDEAVSALDVSVQAQVLNLLNDLKKQFTLTYIFISHDLSVVKYMSDRIIVLKNGKIVESGEADRIYEHPETEYTRELLTAIPGRIQEY